MKFALLLSIFFLISINTLGQKPRKIYDCLLEKKNNEALLELIKFDNNKNYDSDHKILFEIARCLIMIERDLPIYNPILSIQTYNNIKIPSENKTDIDKFLIKYQLDYNKISKLIFTEIVLEAKRINSIDSYKNAIQVCSIENKAELQILLDRKILDEAEQENSILKLNNFIATNSFNSLIIEATNYRDSLILKNTPETFDELKSYVLKYPSSKFNFRIEKRLPDILYKEVEKSEYSMGLCEKFMSFYIDDNRIQILDSITYLRAVQNDSIIGYKNYKYLFNNGRYISDVNYRIESKLLSLDKIYNCFNLDTLIKYHLCENILDFELEYINRFIYLKYYFLEFKRQLNLQFITDIELNKLILKLLLNKEPFRYKNINESKCDKECYLNNHNSFIEKNELNFLKEDEKLKTIFHAIAKNQYDLEFKFEVEKIDNLILIHDLNVMMVGGYHEIQYIGLINKDYRINLEFECCEYSNSWSLIEKQVFKKFKRKITIDGSYYKVNKINTDYYTMTFQFNKNISRIGNEVRFNFGGIISLPFKIIGESIIFMYDEMKIKNGNL